MVRFLEQHAAALCGTEPSREVEAALVKLRDVGQCRALAEAARTVPMQQLSTQAKHEVWSCGLADLASTTK